MHNTDAHRNPRKTSPSTTPPPIQESQRDDGPIYDTPVVGLQSSLQMKPVYYNVNEATVAPNSPSAPAVNTSKWC